MTESLPSTAPGTDPATDVSTVWRTVLDMVGGTTRPPSRISVQLGSASIEMEWAHLADAAAPGVAPSAPGVAPPALEEAGEPLWEPVRTPLVGTFYRAPEPGAKPYVDVGDIVEPGDQIGIVEAMKLMNPILADITGRVVEICVSDGQPVQYDQPLLLLEPWEGE
ncbi:acetyl-CoA carboxylase biotin carboxyl carrier protein [Nonomuraea polychroma]|uniref:Biotin carboxyl carrier protein of acetyl-CoA carboxylase n=1 Tax=Nonomuraea polychroma TaxID=46176 RepID=A0A438MEU6_9ACTN|nr:acetyl-CoA carboxylase biotin carboxyl carrier protein [Nonomuraea polychroma]RVX44138.1 acetyl-CoA carboxylase biotin carboxyl carrier protein [Nonomuraea polychroma]